MLGHPLRDEIVVEGGQRLPDPVEGEARTQGIHGRGRAGGRGSVRRGAFQVRQERPPTSVLVTRPARAARTLKPGRHAQLPEIIPSTDSHVPFLKHVTFLGGAARQSTAASA